jgi:hypothetical protein
VATTQEADEIWTVPLWPSIHERQEADSVNVTIGKILNYRSGSANVATTGIGSGHEEVDSANVAIDTNDRQC